jgi:hypothetical protein
LHVIGAVAVAVSLMILAASPARSQTCLTIDSCESEVDATLQRCVRSCARYDTTCSDNCEDSHDIAIRHCRIMKALCKEPDRARRALPIAIKEGTGH